MQGGRNPFGAFGDPFGGFGDPFGGFGAPFGGFGAPSGGFGAPSGGFGGRRSLIPNFFGGRNPFDDPFFTSPFGNVFESSFFGPTGAPFMGPHTPGFNPHTTGFNPHTTGFEHQPPQPNQSRGPIIEELNSDDEKDEEESGKEKKENPRKHGRPSKEPYVVDPDDEVSEKRSRHMTRRNDVNRMHFARSLPQTRSFTFQSSSVSYGGANGAYYTSSSTRRTGSDGLTFEESKEADSSTRQATHRVSRGIHDKGHSFTRKLNSDGHVDTMQTLHNLHEDELGGFEEAWKGNARKHLHGWNGEFASQDVLGHRSAGHRPNNTGHLALPSTERSTRVRTNGPGSTSQANRRQ
ncbi:hypothetical protein ABFS83_01G084400 [Erythranthe nasuta]